MLVILAASGFDLPLRVAFLDRWVLLVNRALQATARIGVTSLFSTRIPRPISRFVVLPTCRKAPLVGFRTAGGREKDVVRQGFP